MQTATGKSFTLKSLFPAIGNLFHDGLEDEPGFTFQSNEVNVFNFTREVILRDLLRRAETDGETVEAVWSHAGSGVEANVRYRFFADTNVLELDGTLTNRGPKALTDVRGPFSLYFHSRLPQSSVPQLTWLNGGATTEGCFPPPAYAVNQVDLPLGSGKTLFGGRLGGRSTETEIPTVIVTDPVRQAGFVAVFEWPCRSIFSVSRSMTDVSVLAHTAYTGFDLKPGETIALPRALLGFFSGDVHTGSNQLRRHVVRHVMRPVGNLPQLPPLTYNHYYGLDPATWTVETLKQEADVYAELGIEYFVVDADWFLGGFRQGIGNWNTPDPKRFPNGMEEIAAYVESKGMKFGSWLEIEFAMANSQWITEHPDWYRAATNRQNLFYGCRRFNDYLLRLEDPAVRKGVADFIVKWVKQYRIQWIRWDFNDGPAPFWEANESETEVGRLQVGYGEGLLALQDEVMARCPQVHIEACAGGGSRMDLGTLRRAHSAWMNDNSSTIEAIRRFKAGLNWLMPGCYSNSAFLWITHPRHRQQTLESLDKDGYPPYVLRTQMAGSILFSEQTRFFTPQIKATLKSEIAKYKKMRRFLMEDYYPLFQPTSLQDYDGWQFHDPQADEGYFMVFRVHSPKDLATIELRGLTPHRKYVLEDMDSSRLRAYTGGQHLRVRIPQLNGTGWYHYSPA